MLLLYKLISFHFKDEKVQLENVQVINALIDEVNYNHSNQIEYVKDKNKCFSNGISTMVIIALTTSQRFFGFFPFSYELKPHPRIELKRIKLQQLYFF